MGILWLNTETFVGVILISSHLNKTLTRADERPYSYQLRPTSSVFSTWYLWQISSSPTHSCLLHCKWSRMMIDHDRDRPHLLFPRDLCIKILAAPRTPASCPGNNRRWWWFIMIVKILNSVRESFVYFCSLRLLRNTRVLGSIVQSPALFLKWQRSWDLGLQIQDLQDPIALLDPTIPDPGSRIKNSSRYYPRLNRKLAWFLLISLPFSPAN